MYNNQNNHPQGAAPYPTAPPQQSYGQPPPYGGQPPYPAQYPQQQPAAGGYDKAGYPTQQHYPQPYAGNASYPGTQPAYNQAGVYDDKPHTTVHVAHHSGSSSGGGNYLENADKMVRQGFIRKVYSILTIQLFVTFGITLAFVFNDSLRDYVQANPGVLWAAFGVTFACLIALTCFPKFAYTYPRNVICLAVFTLAEAYLVGAVSSFYEVDAVVLALGATVVITLALTAYAVQTKTDFTTKGGMLLVLLIGLLFLGIWSIFFPSNFVRTLYAAIGCIVFGLFIVYDTQRIIGGKNRAFQLTEDDYVYGALSLYIDIIQVFLFLLQLLGGRRRD